MKRIVITVAAVLFLIGGTPTAAFGKSSAATDHQLAFMSVRGGDAAPYLMRGTRAIRVGLADSPGHDCGPASLHGGPRGDELLFDSNRTAMTSYAPNNFEIYRLNLGSGKLVRLTTDPGIDIGPSWAPDGRKIVFARDASPNTQFTPGHMFSIWVMNADGSSQRQITQGDARYSHLDPVWSPDGKKIAFTVYEGSPKSVTPPAIYVMNADGSDQRMLTTDGEYATWSPDGRYIAFNSGRGQPDLESDLFVMRADGSAERSIGHQDGAEIMSSWSPDGTHIAYVHADYWTGIVLANVTPDGEGYDVYATAPTHVWQVTLDRSNRGHTRQQLSHGETDLFPHFATLAKGS